LSRPRILLAKPGLDGHDRGLKVVAMALRDAGAEVIYLGLRVPVADIVATAVAEDATVVGISVLSGAHLPIAEQLLTAMRAAGVEAPLVVGGTIPPRDAEALRRLGAAGVFAAGTPLPGVVDGVLKLAGPDVAGPDVADPVVACPVVACPVVADPVVACPVVADPVVTGSGMTGSGMTGPGVAAR